MSGMPYPPARFAMAQPAQRPQAVKGTKAGSMQSASDTRNCTRPKLIGASSKVKAAYAAPTTAAEASLRVLIFIF